MADQPRDWDRELAAIDAEIAKMPPPKPGQPPAPRAAGGGAVAAPPTHPPHGARVFLGGWIRVLIGVALAVAVWTWPYAHLCGWKLYGYLGAVVMVLVAGVWNVVATWRRRMGLAHAAGIVVLLTGLILAAGAILPRVGYAKQALTWMCP
ncbi:MAG: hypothetical protein ACHQXA_01395 [Gemmatimonadales bacterium]